MREKNETKCRFNMAAKEEEPQLCEREPHGGKSGYCIFHAPVEEKDPKEFWARFLDYSEAKAVDYRAAPKAARDRITLDCRGFFFPATDDRLENEEFPMPVSFANAVFKEFSYFNDSSFSEDVSFENAIFEDFAIFLGTHFKRNASFAGAKFLEVADFASSRFYGDTTFDDTEFARFVDYTSIIINRDVTFKKAVFKAELYIVGACFEGSASFENAKFSGEVIFGESSFRRDTDFVGAEFGGPARFGNLQFRSSCDCSGAFFRDIVIFSEIKIREPASFEYATFGGETSFEKIRGLGNSLPIVFFSSVSLGVTGKLIFRETDLGSWVFSETAAITDADFVSVTWLGDGIIKRKHTRDEIIAKEAGTEEKSLYPAAIEVYRRLRRNFERKLAYADAGDFHIGEMEMRRLGLRQKGWNRFFNLTWVFLHLYRIFGGYGERLRNPIISFIGVGFVFAGLWSLLGFPIPEGENVRISHNFWYAILFSFKTFLTLPGKALCLVQECVGAVQRAFGVGIITLFLLALRRAFRR